MSTWNDPLMRRARNAHMRWPGSPMLPGGGSDIETHNGITYCVLRNDYKVLAVYEAYTDKSGRERIRGLKHEDWPEAIRKEDGEAAL